MAAEFIDILNLSDLDIGHSKRVLFSSDQFHTWIHGDYPGTKGPMHKHTADQQFYCIKGECTFHFPDAPSRALTPGMLVTIPAGQLYQLDNTGNEYMLLLGARSNCRSARLMDLVARSPSASNTSVAVTMPTSRLPSSTGREPISRFLMRSAA